MFGKRAEGVSKNRPAAKIVILLWESAAEASSSAGGDHEGNNVHDTSLGTVRSLFRPV